ncbi:hypothetical protein H920_15850 [Fukomys damarensis]|uniref:Uncharacterized protein n=1 Tax=Fukomys damarensis TaxID=885580 RepID=A0A091CW04_FUKDA|nr:hypothetical protein H920_15850 [Fukomys damarensis]
MVEITGLDVQGAGEFVSEQLRGHLGVEAEMQLSDPECEGDVADVGGSPGSVLAASVPPSQASAVLPGPEP